MPGLLETNGWATLLMSGRNVLTVGTIIDGNEAPPPSSWHDRRRHYPESGEPSRWTCLPPFLYRH
jgi:hypothetical protein